MLRSTRPRSGLLRGGLLLATVLLGCSSCGTYYSYAYAPEREVHDFHLASDVEAPPVARITASILGVMRPKDGLPRRVHARLALDNRGAEPLILRTGRAVLRLTTLHELAPSGEPADVALAPDDRRTVDLFFALPPKTVVPPASLSQLTMEWVVELAGRERTSQANFQRTYYSHSVYHHGYGSWHHGWYGPTFPHSFYWYGSTHRVIYCR